MTTTEGTIKPPPDLWWESPEYQEDEVHLPGQSRLPPEHRQLLERIGARVDAGTLELPTISPALRQCLAMVRSEDVELPDIAATVQTDPVLTAHVLRHTNSALYGLRSMIDDVSHALVHLGRRRVQTLVLEAAVKETSAQIGNRQFARGEWHYALVCAALSRALGRIAGQDRDRCYLMGLLHDLGRIPILGVLDANDALPKDPGSDGPHEIIIEVLHRGVGKQVAKAWDLPPAVRDAIASHLHGRLQDEDSQAEYPATRVVEAAADVCLAFGFGRVQRPFGVHRARSMRDIGVSPEAFIAFTRDELPEVLASLDGLL